MMVTGRWSPNYNERPHNTIIDCIVLHADASEAVAQSLSWILRRESKVSYHYLIGRLGNVYECVRPEHRAWHAGVSAFEDRANCNDYSIGISFGNKCDGIEPYRPDAIEAGVALCVDLMRKWPAITPERITMHSVVALPPGRKVDPGKLFPYEDFIEEVRARL